MCCFRWCGRQLCLRNMPISGVDLTPRTTAVYASDPALPRRPQDSLPPCLLGFGRTRLALASSYRLLLSHPASGSHLKMFDGEALVWPGVKDPGQPVAREPIDPVPPLAVLCGVCDRQVSGG